MKKLLLASLFTLIGLGAVQAQELRVTVEQQKIVGNEFFFDVMLENLDASLPFYLGYTDIVISDVITNSGVPTSANFEKVAGTVGLTNSNGDPISFYSSGAGIATSLMFNSSPNNTRLIINIDFANIGTQANFDELVARIPAGTKVRLSTFKFDALAVNGFVPDITFNTSAAGIKTKVYKAANVDPWNLTRVQGAGQLDLVAGSTVALPTTGTGALPSGLTATALGGGQVSLGWTAGTGYSNLLVLVRETGATNTGSDTTVANQLTYGVNSDWAAKTNANRVGLTSFYVVFNGSGTSVTISGLQSGVDYKYVLVPYNGTLGFNNGFLDPADMAANASSLTITQPSVVPAPLWAVASITLSNTTGATSNSRLTVSWTIDDFANIATTDANYNLGTTRDSILFIAIGAASAYPTTTVIALNNDVYSPSVGKSYNAGANFSAGDTIHTGDVARVIGRAAASAATGTFTFEGLQTDTRYRVLAIPMRGELNTANASNYNQATASRAEDLRFTTPAIITNPVDGVTTIVASSFVATQDGTTGLNFTWTGASNTNASTGVTGLIIVARADGATTFTPENGTVYTADADFSAAPDFSGNKIVYAGSGTSVNITGLEPNRRYHFTAINYGGRVADGNLAYVGDNTWPRHNRHTWMTVSVQAWLGGAFDGTNMNSASLTIPAAQPYNTADFFNYNGTETYSASNVPNAIDWVLVEIRRVPVGDPIASATLATVPNNSGNFVNIGRRAALIKQDGSIVDPANGQNILFQTQQEGDYFVVVYHRNHVPIMSVGRATLGANIMNGAAGNLKVLANVQGTANTNFLDVSSVAAMVPGNAATANFVIDAADRTRIWDERNESGVYAVEDVNLDTDVDAADRSIAWNNRTRTAAAIITTP